MPGLFSVLTFLAILATALNAGLFFIFSVCIMAALARLSPADGAAAMNAINAVIQNPLFFLVFFGGALLSLVLAVLGFLQGGAAGMLALAGGVVFLVTVIGVTVVFNVPLNDVLAATPDGSDAQAVLWQGYLDVWTRWNHVRTGGSLLSVGLFALAFRGGIQPG